MRPLDLAPLVVGPVCAGWEMNFYSHHIGDYLTATAHLTLIEHGAYRRLLDIYYSTEKPLASDKKQIYRLVLARVKEEQAAVDVVLEEFFIETSEGWRHERCEKEIALCNKNRTNGVKGGRPPKNNKPKETQGTTEDQPSENPEITQTKPKNNPDETQAEIPHYPLPNTHYPIPNSVESSSNTQAAVAPEKPSPTTTQSRMTEFAVLLRARGASVTPADPTFVGWVSDGVTDAQALQALDLAKEAREAKASNQPISASYLDTILRKSVLSAPTQATAKGRDAARVAAAKSIFKPEHITHLMGDSNERAIN